MQYDRLQYQGGFANSASMVYLSNAGPSNGQLRVPLQVRHCRRGGWQLWVSLFSLAGWRPSACSAAPAHSLMPPTAPSSPLTLQGTLKGSDGVAWVIDTLTGSVDSPPVSTIVDFPRALNPDCTPNQPSDEGSAEVILDGGAVGVALASEPACGLMIVNADASPPSVEYVSAPSESHAFSYGMHAHPAFDPAAKQLYYVDYGVTQAVPQQVCCLRTDTKQECAGWPTASQVGPCVRMPELNGQTTDASGNTRYLRWEWAAIALDVKNQLLYVAVAGLVNEESITSFKGKGDMGTALMAINTATGARVGVYRMSGDYFNSPPLVVLPSVGAARVIVTTTLGNVVAFAPGAGVSAGPLWTSPDLKPIPDDDLPESTYSFLSVTSAGTLLATTTAGGDCKDGNSCWSDEKAFVAIVNGVRSPTPSGAVPGGLSAGAAAGIAIAVLAVVGLAGATAFLYVPAFAASVRAAVGAVAAGAGSLKDAALGAGASYGRAGGADAYAAVSAASKGGAMGATASTPLNSSCAVASSSYSSL